MAKWAVRYEIKEAAERLNKTEDEILNDLESGKLSAIVRADITSTDGLQFFDWSLIPAEGVRRILAGTHDIIEWTNYGIKRSCQSKQDQIRILTRDTSATTLHDALYWDECTQQPTEETVMVNISAAKINYSADDDEELSALFDPVPVEALDKMFNLNGEWRRWADRAARNGLKSARQGRSMFNPFKATMWLLNRGALSIDLAKCNRILANNLPNRSRDKKHLFVDDPY